MKTDIPVTGPRSKTRRAQSFTAPSSGDLPNSSTTENAESHRAELGLLAHSGAWSFAGIVASSVLGFVLVLMVGRLVRVSNAGVFFVAIAIFTVLQIASQLGADAGLMRMIPQQLVEGRSQDLRSVIVLSVVPPVLVALALAAVLWVFAPQIAHVFIHGGQEHWGIPYLRYLAPLLPVATAMTLLLVAARGFGPIRPYVLIQNIFVPAARPALVAFGIFVGGLSTAMTLVVAWGAPLALGAAAALWVVISLVHHQHRRSRPLLPQRHAVDLSKEFWLFASPRGLSAVFQILLTWVDILMVGLFLSSRDVAVYTVASRYALIATFALQAMGVAIAPQVSRLFARNKRLEAQSVYRFSTGWIVLFSWPALILLAEFSGVFMRLFGAPYVAGATALAILSVGMLVYTATGPNALVLLMSGRSGWNLWTATLALALNVGLNLVLIRALGIEGAAISWTVTLCFASAFTAVILYRFERISPWSRPLGAAVLATAGVAVAGLVGRLLLGDTVIGLVSSLVVGTALCALVAWSRRDTLNLSALRVARRPNRTVPAAT